MVHGIVIHYSVARSNVSKLTSGKHCVGSYGLEACTMIGIATGACIGMPQISLWHNPTSFFNQLFALQAAWAVQIRSVSWNQQHRQSSLRNIHHVPV